MTQGGDPQADWEGQFDEGEKPIRGPSDGDQFWGQENEEMNSQFDLLDEDFWKQMSKMDELKLAWTDPDLEELTPMFKGEKDDILNDEHVDGLDPYLGTVWQRPPIYPKDQDDGNYTVGTDVMAYRSDGIWWPATVIDTLEPAKRYTVRYYILKPEQKFREGWIKGEERNTTQLRKIKPHDADEGEPVVPEEFIEVDDLVDIDSLEIDEARKEMFDYDLGEPEYWVNEDFDEVTGLYPEDTLEQADYAGFDSNLESFWEDKHPMGTPRIEIDHDTLRLTNQSVVTVNLPRMLSGRDPMVQRNLKCDLRKFIEMVKNELEWRGMDLPEATESFDNLTKELNTLGEMSPKTLHPRSGFTEFSDFNLGLEEIQKLKGSIRVYPPIWKYEQIAEKAALKNDYEGVYNAFEAWENASYIVGGEEAIKPPSWASLPGLWAEMYAYRRVADFFEFKKTQFDPMYNEKYRILRKSVDTVEKIVDMLDEHRGSWSLETLTDFLHVSTWATTADSIKYGPTIDASFGVEGFGREMIVDQAKDIFDYFENIMCNGTALDKGQVTIVTGNGGLELLADVAFAQYLLQEYLVNKVVLVVREQPVGLGAIANDVGMLADNLVKWNQPPASRVRRFYQFASDLMDNINETRLEVKAERFLTTPKPFWEMPKDTISLFQESDLVILKGENMYRKLVGDRVYPADTQFAHVVGYFPAPVACLRAVETAPVFGLVSPKPDPQSVNNEEVESEALAKEREEKTFELSTVVAAITNDAEAELKAEEGRERLVREDGDWGQMEWRGISPEEKKKIDPTNPNQDPTPADKAFMGKGKYGAIQFAGSNTLWSEGVSSNLTAVKYLVRRTYETPLIYSPEEDFFDYTVEDRLIGGDWDDLSLYRMDLMDKEWIDWARDEDENTEIEPDRLDHVVMEDQMSIVETEPSLNYLISDSGRQSEIQKIRKFSAMDGSKEEIAIEDHFNQETPIDVAVSDYAALLPAWEKADKAFDQMLRKVKFERNKNLEDNRGPFKANMSRLKGAVGTFTQREPVDLHTENLKELFGTHKPISEVYSEAVNPETSWAYNPPPPRAERIANKILPPFIADLEKSMLEYERNGEFNEFKERMDSMKEYIKGMIADPMENLAYYSWDEIREMGGPAELDQKLEGHHQKWQLLRDRQWARIRDDSRWLEDFMEARFIASGGDDPEVLHKREKERLKKAEAAIRKYRREDPDPNKRADVDADEEEDEDEDGWPAYTKGYKDRWMNMDLSMGNYDEYDPHRYHLRDDLPGREEQHPLRDD